MRLPRLSLRLGTLMLLIAAIALGMAIEQMRRRYNLCMNRIDYFASERDEASQAVRACDERIAILEKARQRNQQLIMPIERWEEMSVLIGSRQQFRDRADHYESRRAYYARAAYLPFLEVPDEGWMSGDLLAPAVSLPPPVGADVP